MSFSDSFSTICAFLLTNRAVYHAWIEHRASIAIRMLPRLIPCLPLAQELARIQELHELSAPMDLTERIVRNARAVSLACQVFIADVVVSNMPDRQSPPHLSDSERLRFTCAFYNVWIPLCSSQAVRSEDDSVTDGATLPANLRDKSLRQLRGVVEITLWLYCDCDAEQERQVEAAICETSGKGSLTDGDGAWVAMMKQIHTAWLAEVERVTGNSGVLVPHRAPLGIFSIFDHWWEYVEMMPDHR